MSYSNKFTVFISTILKRYGIQVVSFNNTEFNVLYYSSDKVEKIPITHSLSEDELDKVVEYLNESPVCCTSDKDIPNEDNC